MAYDVWFDGLELSDFEKQCNDAESGFQVSTGDALWRFMSEDGFATMALNAVHAFRDGKPHKCKMWLKLWNRGKIPQTALLTRYYEWLSKLT